MTATACGSDRDRRPPGFEPRRDDRLDAVDPHARGLLMAGAQASPLSSGLQTEMSQVIAAAPAARQELAELAGTICTALANPRRLALVYALAQRPCSVGELCQVAEASQSSTSRHLAILREQGLAAADRKTGRVVYSLRYPVILDAINLLRQVTTDEISRRQALRTPSPAPLAGDPPRTDPSNDGEPWLSMR